MALAYNTNLTTNKVSLNPKPCLLAAGLKSSNLHASRT